MGKPHPAGAEWGHGSDAVVFLNLPKQGRKPLCVGDELLLSAGERDLLEHDHGSAKVEKLILSDVDGDAGHDVDDVDGSSGAEGPSALLLMDTTDPKETGMRAE